MAEKVHRQPTKDLKIHSCFFARDAWRHLSACTNEGHTQFNSLPRLQKAGLSSRIVPKSTVQPMIKFSLLIYRGESRLELKF